MHQVLILDKHGRPLRWACAELAITYAAKKQILWSIGVNDFVNFRGGTNHVTGKLSILKVSPIVAIDGDNSVTLKRLQRPPRLTNRDLFARDRHKCAYCKNIFPTSILTRDHVLPRAKGGKDTWENVVTACETCNHKKGASLLSELNLNIDFVPYAPSKAECMLLRSTFILPEQAEYLAQFTERTAGIIAALKEIFGPEYHVDR